MTNPEKKHGEYQQQYVIPLPIAIGMMQDLLNKNLLTGGRSRVVARDDEIL